jgi:hypothetical protein
MSVSGRPWGPGAATGIGSMPGTEPAEAARLVFGELPELPYVPELPDRGPGSDLLGRGAVFLVDLPVEIVPSGWRLTARPGRDLRRSQDQLAYDLDAVEAEADGYRGPLKVQVAGPWTLAANLELPSGHRVVNDHGATRELAQSLAEGIRVHLADLAARVPGAIPVLQLDEPSLPAVLAGAVPTPSGYGTVRAVEAEIAEQVLRDVLALAPAGQRVVHCCAADAPLGLFRSAGADALAFDSRWLVAAGIDALGEAVEAGLSLWLGVVPGTDAPISRASAGDPIRRLWRTLGFPLEQLAGAVVPTPACGLAGASPDYVRRVFTTLREVGQDLLDPDGRAPGSAELTG